MINLDGRRAVGLDCEEEFLSPYRGSIAAMKHREAGFDEAFQTR